MPFHAAVYFHVSQKLVNVDASTACVGCDTGWLEKLRPEGTGFSALKTKKWQKRYFKLEEGVLRWAHSRETIDDDSPARVPLDGARVVHVGQSLEFTLVPSRETERASSKIRAEYALRATMGDDATRWCNRIERSIQQLQWRADIDVFSNQKPGAMDVGIDTPVRALDLDANTSVASIASVASNDARIPVLSTPIDSPRVPEGSALVNVADAGGQHGLPVDAEPDGTGLLAIGNIEPISAVADKLRAYEDSRYLSAAAPFDLLDVERRMLKAADVHEKGYLGRQNVRRLFLFNDSLLIVNPFSSDMYEFQSLLPLDGISFERKTDDRQLHIKGKPGSGEQEQWNLFFESAAIADAWYSATIDVTRRRLCSSSMFAVPPTPGSSQELVNRTLDFNQDTDRTCTRVSGSLELLVQGSDRWLSVFAHARYGHLHFYRDASQCPFETATADPPPASPISVSAQAQPDEFRLEERLEQQGLSVAFVAAIRGIVSLEDIKEYCDDDEYWEDLRLTEPLSANLHNLDGEWSSFVASFDAILATRPPSRGALVSRTRSRQASGLLKLGETLSSMGLEQQSSAVVETVLRDDPSDPMALQIRDELAARGHPVVLSLNLGELIGLEMLEFSPAVAHYQQITLRHEELGVFRLRQTSGTLELWYKQLQRVWLEFVALLGTPKYDHWIKMSQTTSKLVLEYKERAKLDGSWTPGARRDKQVAIERSRYVEAKFQKAFHRVHPEQDPTRWYEWIASEPQAVIKQADRLMEELAVGMAQAGRNSEVIEWYANEFYKRFRLMLRAFGIGVGEGLRTTSEAMAVIDSDEAGLNSSVASSVALDDLQTADAIAIIGWCRRFKQRCIGMRIPDGLFDEDPTDSGLFRGLVNAHMPSYQGFLKKKGGYSSGGATATIGFNGWQQRYFCLKNAVLSYYKTTQMHGERGRIPAEEINKVEIEGQDIKIYESGRVLELRAPSLEEANVWHDRLRKAHEAARAMEKLTSASTACIEVQAFDGQQQVAEHSIARDCQERFREANEKLELHLLNHDEVSEDSSAFQAELYMKAADALLEACSDRLRRVPPDRVDVKTFYGLEYHYNISRHMRTIKGLGSWPAVSVFRLMFWAREHDQAIARLIGRMLTVVEAPLACCAKWESDLPGFCRHPLPRFSGWLRRQRWEDHEWQESYIVVENMCITWYEVEENNTSVSEPEPGSELGRQNAAPSYTELIGSLTEIQDIMREKDEADPDMQELQDAADEILREMIAAERHLKIEGTLNLSEMTRVKSSMIRNAAALSADVKVSSVDASVYLKVPRDLMSRLMECLNHSCYPALPGQSRDRALSDSDAINPIGAQIVADYHTKSHEELTAEIAEQFREAFVAESEKLTTSASRELDLDAVLTVFSIMLEQLVQVVDEVLFSGLIEEDIINFNIAARHEQFVEYFTNLCDPEKELFPGSDLNVTVTRHDIVPLLRWAAEYHSCLHSIGETNVDVQPLEVCCRTPIAEHVAATTELFENWCSQWLPPLSIQREVEMVRQRNGQYITSLPEDLFRLICDATRSASDSACERLLVNTVMGVIEPQVRVWAANFVEKLSPKDPHNELKMFYADDMENYKAYLCACLNNMDICFRNTASWSEVVEERVESKDMMRMVGVDDESGYMNTDRLSDSFRKISNAAVECLCNLIMAEIAPNLQNISTADWLTHNKMIPMLDSLAAWFTSLEDLLAKRHSKKVISSLMRTMIERYVSELLKLARTPKEKKRARQGQGLTHKDFAAAMQEDIRKLKKFFGSYLRDTAVRAVLQTAEVVAQLHGCELDSFVAECTKAAHHPDFSIIQVKLVLEAREDVTPPEKKKLVAEAGDSIAMIKEALNPAAPPRAGAAEGDSEQPVAADTAGTADACPTPVLDTPDKTMNLHKTQSNAPKQRVQALHAFTAMQAGDLSFQPKAVIVVTDNTNSWWKGYVERVSVSATLVH